MQTKKTSSSLLLASFRQLFRRDRKGVKRACFLYYQHFNALLYREAKTLQEQGFEVDILSLRTSRDEKVFHTYEGLNVYTLQLRPSAEKTVLLYFLRLLIFYVKASLLLTFLAPERRYKVVHVTTPPDIMVFAALVPKLFGARIILDIHDIGPELFMRKLNVKEGSPVIVLLKFLERISARFADHVITVTDFWKEKIQTRSVPPSKCTLLLNVPDDQLFTPSTSPRQRRSFNLFYHGSIEEHFGIDTMLEAMPLIREQIPNVLLHIYGGAKGRIYEECRSLVARLGLGMHVMFYPGIAFYNLPKILRNADLGIVPTKDSTFSNEAVSMKALEYMALGIPIVISRTKAHDFYYDSSMVKFFMPRDSDELARCVIDLYHDKDEREALATNARLFLKKKGWAVSKEIYADIVKRLIGDRR